MEEKEEEVKTEPTLDGEELSPDELLDKAENYIEIDFLYAAQNVLNTIEQDSGRKYYLQSRIYKAKCWYNEQRKQLKAAVKKEPDNETYKKELNELIEFSKTAEYKNTKQHPKRGQMGDADCCDCCCEMCDSIGPCYC